MSIFEYILPLTGIILLSIILILIIGISFNLKCPNFKGFFRDIKIDLKIILFYLPALINNLLVVIFSKININLLKVKGKEIMIKKKKKIYRIGF